MIRQGPTDLFTIDSQTGVIKTLQGLDYEHESQHVLIIGTQENLSNKAGATTRLIVYVQVILRSLFSIYIPFMPLTVIR